MWIFLLVFSICLTISLLQFDHFEVIERGCRSVVGALLAGTEGFEFQAAYTWDFPKLSVQQAGYSTLFETGEINEDEWHPLSSIFVTKSLLQPLSRMAIG